MKWFQRLFRRIPKVDYAGLTAKPPITNNMKERNLTWRWSLKKLNWVEACDFCGGNCGQCGITMRVGNIPASMDRMVDHIEGRRK